MKDFTKTDDSKFKAAFTDIEIADLNDLYEAILTMDNAEEMHRFFMDLCSINELHAFLHRWQIVRRIEQGKSYEEIINELAPESDGSDKEEGQSHGSGRVRGKARSSTKVSSTTISRVKNCYVNPDGGYRTALKRLNERQIKEKEE